MPIIGWTQADVLQQKVLEAGPQKAVLSDADGPKASSSGKGMNLFLTFRLTEGDAAGKELKYALSTGVKNASLLGDLQFAPMGQISLVHAAINNIPLNEIKPGSCDVDELKDRPLILMLGVDIANGKPTNTINAFLPANSTNTGPSF